MKLIAKTNIKYNTVLAQVKHPKRPGPDTWAHHKDPS